MKYPENHSEALFTADYFALTPPDAWLFGCGCNGCQDFNSVLFKFIDNENEHTSNKTPPTELSPTEPPTTEPPTTKIELPKVIQQLNDIIVATIEGDLTAKTILLNYAQSLYTLRNQLINVDIFQLATHEELFQNGYNAGLQDGTSETVITAEIKKQIHDEVTEKTNGEIKGSILIAIELGFQNTRITHIKRTLVTQRILNYLFPDDPQFKNVNILTD